MYSFRYRFYPKGDVGEFVDGPLSSLYGSLLRNGQVLDKWDVAQADGCLEMACLAPDADSLDSRYYDEYAARHLAEVVSASEREPEYSLVGPAIDLGSTCECEQPSSYVLFTTFIHVEPPVVCGDCGRHIPLYKLPRSGVVNEFGDILCWQATYQTCDQLYIGSGIGELFGLKQMRDPKSQLTREGLEICRDLSAKLGRPFYYYLIRHTRSGDPLPKRRCPSCGRDWEVLDEPLAKWMYRRCEECGFAAE